MPQIKKTNSEASVPTAAELRSWYAKNQKKIEEFAKATNLTTLRDVTKNNNVRIQTFNKESLRSYLENIGSNEKNLRNLSRFLYYRCQAFYRLIMYNATMFELNARSVIPKYDLIKDNDIDKMKKSWADTIKVLDNMGLQREMIKAFIKCFTEDVFYGVVYYDDTGMFILPWDPDYAKISGIYQTGDLAYSIDMTYFRSRQQLLEYLGEPFNSMYRLYEQDSTKNKWQPMPDEYAICLKFRYDDIDLIVPPYSGLFNSLINLTDLEDIQAIADEQEIYKMLWIELETIQNSKSMNDWKIDPDIVSLYFNRMIEEAIPDYVSAAIVPGKVNSISYNGNDTASDINKIQNSTKAVFNSGGGAQVLNGATISGTEAFKAALKADQKMASATLLPQIQAWVNRFMTYHVTNPSKVIFFDVSIYTKDAYKESLLNDAQYGLPTKLAVNTLNGYSEIDTLAMNFLEEEILHVSAKFNPLQSSFTTSGKKKEIATDDINNKESGEEGSVSE